MRWQAFTAVIGILVVAGTGARARHADRDRSDRVPGVLQGRRVARRTTAWASTSRSPAARSASSIRAIRSQQVIQDIELGKDRRRQGALRRDVRAHQAGRHGEGERPDVARRAQSRPAGHCSAPTERALRRRRPRERLAGRQRGHEADAGTDGTADDDGWRRTTGSGAGREECGRLRRHRAGLRPHRQPLRSGFAAADRADQSGAVHAGEPGHRASDSSSRAIARRWKAWSSARHAIAASDWKFCGGGDVRCAAAAHETAGADLPEERLRSGEALPGRVHREGSVRPRRRLRRVARRRVVLQDTPTRTTPARQSARRWQSRTASRAASRSRATSCAAGCTSASTRTRRSARCTTACGRSSRAAASR